MSANEHLHAAGDALIAALAARLEAICRDALAARGRAVLALAGGRTPLPVYRRLAAADLDWSRVTILPTDERWVPHAHAASNQRELADSFAAAQGIALLPLVPADATGAPNAGFAESQLATIAGDFDAVLLGMGADAHTASLFPGDPALAAALDPANPRDAVVIHPDPLPPEAPFDRITLTASRLLRTRHSLLAITGERKLAVLRAAQAAGDPLSQPIAAFLHAPRASPAPPEIHWSP